MLIHTASVGMINDTPPQPLVGPAADNVVPALLQEALEMEQQRPGEKVTEAPVAELALHPSTDKLLRAAHVQVAVHAQVWDQGLDAVHLGVRVVLRQIEPIVLVDVVLQDVPDGLVHIPDGTLVAVGDHLHAMGHLALVRASEEHHHVQVVANGAVDCHPQGVYGVLGRKDTHKEVLSDAKLRAGISGSKKKKLITQMLKNYLTNVKNVFNRNNRNLFLLFF